MELNLEFLPLTGIGKFKLTMREKDLIPLFNKPLEFEYHEDGDKCYSRTYRFKNNTNNINFVYHFNGRGYDYLTIFTDNLLIDSNYLMGKSINKTIEIVKNFCSKKGIIFKYQYEEGDLDTCIIFDKIGLTVWFEEDIVSDICVSTN